MQGMAFFYKWVWRGFYFVRADKISSDFIGSYRDGKGISLLCGGSGDRVSAIDSIREEFDMIAVVCPVCQGGGMLIVPENCTSASSTPITIICHGCKGKGWVEVHGGANQYDDDYAWKHTVTGRKFSY